MDPGPVAAPQPARDPQLATRSDGSTRDWRTGLPDLAPPAATAAEDRVPWTDDLRRGTLR